MKVKDLIKQLQKYDPDAQVGTFADKKYDFSFTPIEEVILQESVELHHEFRRRAYFKLWEII